MSTLGKVFVVLVLIFAIAVAVANMVLFAQRIDWKGKSDVAVADKEKAENNLKAETEKYKGNLNAQKMEIDRVNMSLDRAKDMLTTLQTAKNRVEEDSKQMSIKFEGLRADYDKMARELETLVKGNEKLASDLKAAENQAAADRRAREAAEDKALQVSRDRDRFAEDIKRASERLAQVELENQNLRDNLTQYERQYGSLPVKAPVPLINGKVREVGDLPTNLVLLNVGDDDGAYVGLRFIVYRGAAYVGDVVVEQVFQDYSAARPIPGTLIEAIKAGDDVTTKLGVEAAGAETGL